MDDITVVSETTIEEIKEALLFNDEITAITSSVIYGGASRLVGLIFKGHPALKVVDALVYTIEVNSALIANQLKFMGENNYTVFVTTSIYEFIGYGTGGSSYLTYKLKTAEYSYK